MDKQTHLLKKIKSDIEFKYLRKDNNYRNMFYSNPFVDLTKSKINIKVESIGDEISHNNSYSNCKKNQIKNIRINPFNIVNNKVKKTMVLIPNSISNNSNGNIKKIRKLKLSKNITKSLIKEINSDKKTYLFTKLPKFIVQEKIGFDIIKNNPEIINSSLLIKKENNKEKSFSYKFGANNGNGNNKLKSQHKSGLVRIDINKKYLTNKATGGSTNLKAHNKYKSLQLLSNSLENKLFDNLNVQKNIYLQCDILINFEYPVNDICSEQYLTKRMRLRSSNLSFQNSARNISSDEAGFFKGFSKDEDDNNLSLLKKTTRISKSCISEDYSTFSENVFTDNTQKIVHKNELKIQKAKRTKKLKNYKKEIPSSIQHSYKDYDYDQIQKNYNDLENNEVVSKSVEEDLRVMFDIGSNFEDKQPIVSEEIIFYENNKNFEPNSVMNASNTMEDWSVMNNFKNGTTCTEYDQEKTKNNLFSNHSSEKVDSFDINDELYQEMERLHQDVDNSSSSLEKVNATDKNNLISAFNFNSILQNKKSNEDIIMNTSVPNIEEEVYLYVKKENNIDNEEYLMKPTVDFRMKYSVTEVSDVINLVSDEESDIEDKEYTIKPNIEPGDIRTNCSVTDITDVFGIDLEKEYNIEHEQNIIEPNVAAAAITMNCSASNATNVLDIDLQRENNMEDEQNLIEPNTAAKVIMNSSVTNVSDDIDVSLEKGKDAVYLIESAQVEDTNCEIAELSENLIDDSFSIMVEPRIIENATKIIDNNIALSSENGPIFNLCFDENRILPYQSTKEIDASISLSSLPFYKLVEIYIPEITPYKNLINLSYSNSDPRYQRHSLGVVSNKLQNKDPRNKTMDYNFYAGGDNTSQILDKYLQKSQWFQSKPKLQKDYISAIILELGAEVKSFREIKSNHIKMHLEKDCLDILHKIGIDIDESGMIKMHDLTTSPEDTSLNSNVYTKRVIEVCRYNCFYHHPPGYFPTENSQPQLEFHNSFSNHPPQIQSGANNTHFTNPISYDKSYSFQSPSDIHNDSSSPNLSNQTGPVNHNPFKGKNENYNQHFDKTQNSKYNKNNKHLPNLNCDRQNSNYNQRPRKFNKSEDNGKFTFNKSWPKRNTDFNDSTTAENSTAENCRFDKFAEKVSKVKKSSSYFDWDSEKNQSLGPQSNENNISNKSLEIASETNVIQCSRSSTPDWD